MDSTIEHSILTYVLYKKINNSLDMTENVLLVEDLLTLTVHVRQNCVLVC